MNTLCDKYGYTPNQEAIDKSIGMIASNLDEMISPKVLMDCFGIMDLTTLNTNDTEASVRKLVGKVNGLRKDYPQYPLPASVCVYPNFAAIVAEERNDPELHVTTVSSCFPSAQSFLEVKVRECELAVEAGADEIDIVLALNAFLAGDESRAAEEISAMRKAIDSKAEAMGKKVVLKVILETGLLVTPGAIAEASFLAMEDLDRQGQRERYPNGGLCDVRGNSCILQAYWKKGGLQGCWRYLQLNGCSVLLFHRLLNPWKGMARQVSFPLGS